MPHFAAYINTDFQTKTACGLELVFKSDNQRSQWKKMHKKKCERCANAFTDCPSVGKTITKIN